jgi:polyhydroxyalkanoate synthesis regulator phasin
MADNDLLKRLLDAGMTFTALTQARAEEVIRDFVRAGAVQAEQAQSSVDELIDRGRRNRERLVETVRSEIEQQLAKLDLASREDVESMVQRFLDGVAAALRDAAGWAEEAGPGRPAGRKAAARKGGAKKAAKKAPAKKAAKKSSKATKKGGAKKAAKKAPAKKAAKKSSKATKKGGARKSPARAGSSTGR